MTRRVISIVLGLLLLAIAYPGFIRHGDSVDRVGFARLVGIVAIPVVLICVTANRSRRGEAVGWGVLVLLYGLLFWLGA